MWGKARERANDTFPLKWMLKADLAVFLGCARPHHQPSEANDACCDWTADTCPKLNWPRNPIVELGTKSAHFPL